jgi:hypothetical protein
MLLVSQSHGFGYLETELGYPALMTGGIGVSDLSDIAIA